MRNSHNRLNRDFDFIEGSVFSKICRCFNTNHFTRNRKLSLYHLVLSILNRKGLSLSMELRKFFNLLRPQNPEAISNAGYLKQRLKLNPAAFLSLSDFHVKNFYASEHNLIKFNNYFVFAVDGSCINLPNTEENHNLYGSQSNSTSKQQVQLGVSCLYDVYNKMILDCTVNRCTFNERAQAELHMEKIPFFIQDQRFIVLLDRGYPSSFFFIDRLEKEQKFIVRLNTADFRQEQKNMQSDDEDVEIVFTQARINPYRKTDLANKLKTKGSITLRFVKILLMSGAEEYLATNLPREEFSSEDIKKLYGHRWQIETAYDTLKNKFMIENFTGKKPVIIGQDIFSAIYLYNIAQDILRDAEIEQKKKALGTPYKHKMIINTNLAIGIIKEELIHMVLEKDTVRRRSIFDRIIGDISKNIIPVRENRQFYRSRKYPQIKYSLNKKRAY